MRGHRAGRFGSTASASRTTSSKARPSAGATVETAGGRNDAAATTSRTEPVGRGMEPVSPRWATVPSPYTSARRPAALAAEALRGEIGQRADGRSGRRSARSEPGRRSTGQPEVGELQTVIANRMFWA